MSGNNKSLKLVITSVFSLALVIVFAFGSEIVMGERDKADVEKNESFVSDIDVFENISFVDLEKSEDAFSSPDMSENEESSEQESTYEESSEESEESSSTISEASSVASESSEESEEPSLEASKEPSSEYSSEASESSEESSEEPSSEDVNNSFENVGFPSDVTLLDGGQVPFVYFKQDDPKYENLPYGTDKIGSHGCGPVNMAMIISTYTGKVIYPDEAAKWSYKKGYWTKGTGTSHSLMTAMAKAYGVPVKTVAQGSWTEVINALKQGKLVITRVKNGIFAKNNHFFTLRGITEDGKILVANSISYEDSVKEWDLNTLKGQVNLGFWIYG